MSVLKTSFSTPLTAFRLACHCLGNVMWLIFLISQIVTGDIIWAAIVCCPIYVMYRIALLFFGWAASVILFLVCWFLTFQMVNLNNSHDRITKWLDSNPQYANVYVHGNRSVDRYNNATKFKNDLHQKWLSSYSDQWLSHKGVDTDKAWKACWDNFVIWINDGAKGSPPIPTEDVVFKYCEQHKTELGWDENHDN